jgi:hypothetical protein
MGERVSAYETGVCDIERFSRLLRGRVFAPPADDRSPSYWNGHEWVRSRPRLVVQCRGPFDVVEAVRYANARDIRVAVWTSGEARAHRVPTDDAMVVDLSHMKRVFSDPRAGTVIAEPGLSGRELEEYAYRNGRSTPAGMVPEASIADATLDGEHGWLSRRDGLICDSLHAASLVTPQGDYVQVDAEHETDLFWAIRGGGPNFGIVTSLTYGTRAADEAVFGGSISYPLTALRQVLDFYFETTTQCGDELTLRLMLSELGGRSACTLQILSHIEAAENAALAAALRQLAAPLANTLGVASYPQFSQGALVPCATPVSWTLPPGACYVAPDWLTPAHKTTLLEWLERWPAKQCVVVLEHLGGKIGRIAAAATAFAYRDSPYRLSIGLISREAQDTMAAVRYQYGLLSALGADPLRYAFDEPPGCRGHAWHAYAGNYNRLASIKRIGDPDGRFVGNGLFDHLYR